MSNRKHRPIRHCPQCDHKFKNYKWKRSWRADGVAATCPQYGTFVYDWPKIAANKLAEGE